MRRVHCSTTALLQKNSRIILTTFFNVKEFPRTTTRGQRSKRPDEILTSCTPSHTIARMTRTDVRKAIIPAAGLGTRFLPATKASPKEMLPLVDKPLIQYVVEEAVASGIEDIIVITGRGKRAIEDHFDRSLELEENLKGSGRAGTQPDAAHLQSGELLLRPPAGSHGPWTRRLVRTAFDRRRALRRHSRR